jgi:hypothetical protein
VAAAMSLGSNVRQLRPKPLLLEPEHALAAGVRPAGLWPAMLPGLVEKTIGAYEPCADCGTGTWVRYGGRAVCLRCAQWRAGE